VSFPSLKRAPLSCKPIVSVVVLGVHIVLRVGENGEAVFAGHAERCEARCDGSPKIVRRRAGALDDGASMIRRRPCKRL
jgi:hypothetical protein